MRTADAAHDRLKDLLGGFADGELDAETRQSVAEHLAECQHCRRELDVQQAVAARLGAEPIAPADDAFVERVFRNLPVKDASVARPTPAARPARRRLLAAPWLGWAVAAALAVAWIGWPPASRQVPSHGLDEPVPMIEEAFANYRGLEQRELPVEFRDANDLAAHMPFPVTPLASPEVTLIGAWTDVIRGEPAAVLAYRWQNHVLVQYLVSESLFFRQPAVRDIVAEAGLFTATDDARSVVAWPETGAGSLVVGNVSVQELVRLRL